MVTYGNAEAARNRCEAFTGSSHFRLNAVPKKKTTPSSRCRPTDSTPEKRGHTRNERTEAAEICPEMKKLLFGFLLQSLVCFFRKEKEEPSRNSPLLRSTEQATSHKHRTLGHGRPQTWFPQRHNGAGVPVNLRNVRFAKLTVPDGTLRELAETLPLEKTTRLLNHGNFLTLPTRNPSKQMPKSWTGYVHAGETRQRALYLYMEGVPKRKRRTHEKQTVARLSSVRFGRCYRPEFISLAASRQPANLRMQIRG